MTRLPAKGPGHGGPVRGYSWEPFQPGHTLSTKHGAYSVVRLSARATEIADSLREIVPTYMPSDEPSVQLCGWLLARLEKTAEALDAADEQAADGLRRDARGWASSAMKLLDLLGCNPTARARLGVDLVQVERFREEQLARLQAAGQAAFDARDAQEAER